jgi:hypothetical protein
LATPIPATIAVTKAGLSPLAIRRAREVILPPEAYMPAKGYAGPDDFKVAVDFKDRTGVGKFYIHFNVTVK